MKRAVIAFSGGLDSTTLLYHILRNTDQILAVFFNYNSKHHTQELAAARGIASRWKGIELFQVTIPPGVFLYSKSALLSGAPMPHKTYEDLAQTIGPSPTVVPFRNANIISMCTSIAASREYDEVYIATHATDAHNWAYPDCTPEFMGAMANAVYVGTYGKVRLRTPFAWMTKAAIVALAFDLRVPVNLTRSCYEANETACGECPTCVERINAFTSQGLVDPIRYKEDPDWYGCTPWPHTEETK